jgi:chromosome condensin MukBEF ATPase and DNA-binding subunit MukB
VVRVLRYGMVEALRKAIETFAAAPQPPQAVSGASGAFAARDQISRNAKHFENEVAQWRSNLLAVRHAMTDLYKGLTGLRLLDEALKERMQGLDEFIEQVDREIEDERLALERSKLSNRQAIATIMKSSSDNGHFMKKVLKRLYQAGVDQHNARVDFYHFLLGLRAEYNPDYKGGPTFESAKDLIADLHKHVR